MAASAVPYHPAAEPDVVPQHETIHAMNVTATLSPDRVLKITENINYDFGSEEKHGIYRTIPESYVRDGATYNFRYEVKSVKRDGADEPYSESRQGDSLYLKIGQADKTITGSHTYAIEYQTQKAINFFPDHSELYWNVTGNDWAIDIEQSTFSLTSPLDSATSTPKFVCYTGHLGSTEQDCKLEHDKAGAWLVKSTRLFNAGEGMTVVFSFPPGMIKAPTSSEIFWGIIWDNLILLVPLLAFLIMFYLWRTRGKDLPPDTVIPQYESPRGLSPIVLSGALGSGQIPSPGTTATIIDMARKNYLHIEYGTQKGLLSSSQTFTFLKKNPPPENAQPWEKFLWNGLFSDGTRERSTFADLKEDDFYRDVIKAAKAASKALQDLHIFVSNPYAVRALYFVAAIVISAIVWIVGIAAPVGGLASFVTFLIIAIFGWNMPRRTKEGVAIAAEVKGFKWFLSVTEEERLKFHNAPARTPEEFMELLPAAIALGVEKQWADQFKGLQFAPPDWAEGDVHALTGLALINSIQNMHTQSAAAVYSPPASTAGTGGSGFSGGGSGGGGGGGGGGSW